LLAIYLMFCHKLPHKLLLAKGNYFTLGCPL